MPVTARLSKLFYDRLGEAIATELVDWLNQVDATYRSDLRETNELNYARFEAKLEQRLAELRAELKAELKAEVSSVRADLAAIRADIVALEARLDARLATASRDQTRFMFVAWAALIVPIIGLWFR